MALENIILKPITKKKIFLIDEIQKTLNCNQFEKQLLLKRIEVGDTYHSLEIAQRLYKRKLMDEWLITKIAYKHYIKMQNSHIKTKYLNELVMMYPKMEYLR